MTRLMFAILILMFSGACLAQDEVTVQVKGKKQAWPAEELQKLYLSACAAVQREYGQTHPPKPRVTVVLGADEDELAYQEHEIRLKKWDGFRFTQGIVLMAFQELMNTDQQMSIARRAVGWADATVNISGLNSDTHRH